VQARAMPEKPTTVTVSIAALRHVLVLLDQAIDGGALDDLESRDLDQIAELHAELFKVGVSTGSLPVQKHQPPGPSEPPLDR
jgi:hypothetical protein